MMLDRAFATSRVDRKRLRRRLSIVCPDHTGGAIMVMIACALAALLLLIAASRAEETDVSIAEYLGVRETVTERWQTIHMSKEATITVWFERPDPMELGDDISFYSTFEGCYRENFTYDWQYSSDGVYWTSFGSSARKNTTYSAMLAGQQVRLEAAWR